MNETTTGTPRKRAPGAGRKAAAKSDGVKQVRAALGITQEAMAVRLGCTYSALRVMERQGRLPGESEAVKRLQKMAKQAGIDLTPEAAAQQENLA